MWNSLYSEISEYMLIHFHFSVFFKLINLFICSEFCHTLE